MKLLLMAVASLAFTGAAAFADSITSTDTLSTAFSPNTTQGVSLLSFDAALTGASLNPADYILTGVTLNFDETSTALVGIFNFNGQSASFSAATQALALTAALDVNGSAVSTATSAPVYNGSIDTSVVPYTIIAYGVTGTNSGAAFSETYYAPTAPNSAVTASGTSYSVSSGQLSLWLSTTPTLGLTVNPGSMDSYGTTTSGTGQLAYGGTTSSTADVTVTYDYQVVPEPSTWALMLGGLGLLVWRIRARRA